jgi:four helix bundle protein
MEVGSKVNGVDAGIEAGERKEEVGGNVSCGCEMGNDAGKGKGIIKSYEDLEVYQNSYKGMLIVFKKIIPVLPKEEKYDLADQLRRSTKAIPRLLAEGHSKRHQKKGFQKYIDDAHAESNETIVSLNQVKDLYASAENTDLCAKLIRLYDIISRQLFKLSCSWVNYPRDKR